MEALLHPGAMLRGLRPALAAAYQDALHRAQEEKGSGAGERVPAGGEDAYKRCLTQAEIQENISRVNAHAALEEVDDAVRRGDAPMLHRALQDPALSLPPLQRDNLQLCLELLSAQRQQKALELGYVELLDEEEVAMGIRAANETGEEERASERERGGLALGTAAINQAIREGRAAQTLRVLRNPAVALRGVLDACAAEYQEQLEALAATKSPTGSSKPRWVRHRLRDGSEFYLSLQSFEGSWERPRDGELCATHLSRDEIQIPKRSTWSRAQIPAQESALQPAPAHSPFAEGGSHAAPLLFARAKEFVVALRLSVWAPR
ncbi:ras GTPase-activating-like protein IQGAP3 [Numida meleagris]|uniref:ras GTPase-activating-like protein IQGAP3 n=1 Tax=Numida meleagris TaxID=8996 RepID=UPI000B3DD936|nr:ras GTPase-activating-like protein IQGAP3 [Numida meleagris]